MNISGFFKTKYVNRSGLIPCVLEKVKRITTLLAVMAMVFGLTGLAKAVTVCKDGTCDETSIKAALSNPDYSGKDVIVGPGTYFEGYMDVYNRDLMSESDNPFDTIIDGGGVAVAGGVINGGGGTIRGFTIRGGNNQGSWGGAFAVVLPFKI